MTGLLYRLGGLCVRRRRLVLGLWLAVFAAVVVGAHVVRPDLYDDLTLPGTNSQRAATLYEDAFPSDDAGRNPLVLVAPAGHTLVERPYARSVGATARAIAADPDVGGATSPLGAAAFRQLGPARRIGYIAVNLKVPTSELTLDDAERISAEAAPARAAGVRTAFGGHLGAKLSPPSTGSSEAIGLAVAVVVLLLTFGTVVAMGIPIVTAGVGLVAGLSIVTLLSHVVDVPKVGPTLATMIGLGVGIDYALFIVTRHRAQRAQGLAVEESIARAVATSGAAVLFAACTVVVALVALLVVGIPLVTELGLTAALVVVVAALAAVTLLPALLALAGTKIDALALPGRGGGDPGAGRGWHRWAEAVARRPWPALIVALVALAALAAPMLGLYLGQQDDGALPRDTQARQAYDDLAAGFGPGANGPLGVVVDLGDRPARPDPAQAARIALARRALRSGAPGAHRRAAADLAPYQRRGVVPGGHLDQDLGIAHGVLLKPAGDPRLQTLWSALVRVPGVHIVGEPKVSTDRTVALLSVIPTTSPSSRATQDLVERLRRDTLPGVTRRIGVAAYVGGSTAGYIDLARAIGHHMLETILVVIALSFVLLLLAFRSVVIPLKAGLMNLVSIGAAFGVVTAVFEKGVAGGVVGLDGEVPIVSFVPLLMFAVLFGLSMDYEVFLMSRMREAWNRTGDNRTAVVEGLASTGRVITSAALIMVSVFFAFVLSNDPTVKQFGVGMGVAVAIDATLVRCLLVPAIMLLMGRANWWLPRFLEHRLPRFSIEGDEFFSRRDDAGNSPPGVPGDVASPRPPILVEKEVA